MFTHPNIPADEITPTVQLLLGMIEALQENNQRLKEELQGLRDEIAILKGEKAKPVFKPSKMHEEAGKEKDSNDGDSDTKPPKKRAGSAKRSKTAELVIHHTEIILPTGDLPSGAIFKGYRDFIVQDLLLQTHNICYRLAVFATADGERVGQLPAAQRGCHFGTTLRSAVLYFHHHCHVTQPLLLEMLREWGVDISAGQIENLLAADKTIFHAEKDQILVAGLAHSTHVTVDDSGARHQGNNGYVTHIGNDFFGWFASTNSKSRLNFLSLLQAGKPRYQAAPVGLDYWHKHGLPQALRAALMAHAGASLHSVEEWDECLVSAGIVSARHRRIACEGALLAALAHSGCHQNLAIISDGAAQFSLLQHGLCWIHAERLVHKLIPVNTTGRVEQQRVRAEIWTLYAALKDYQKSPDNTQMSVLEAEFDRIFSQKTTYATLQALLRRLHRRKDELLLVLKRPDVPLHTNGSETDIRDFVKKRKVSGGTRSDIGRQCRDTFASLKKTCRKLGISFWQYLQDRITQANTIQQLADNIKRRAEITLGY